MNALSLCSLASLGALVLSASTDAQVATRDRQVTTRASVGTGGTQADSHTFASALSGTGRFVAFDSQASNLVSGDTNGFYDVFVRDRWLGVTMRASVGPGERQGNGNSAGPTLSADGRYVVFWSAATNLVPGDTNGSLDVFVRDLVLGQTVRVSVDSLGAQADFMSITDPRALSADGRFVAFTSWASNLVPGDTNALADVFVHDRATGSTVRASVDSFGGQGNQVCLRASVSDDGVRVAFETFASNLVPGDTNGLCDVYVHDFVTGTTVRVSVDSAGEQGIGGDSEHPVLSGDGRCVAFESLARNLVLGDTNGNRDVFVHELDTGITTRVGVFSNSSALSRDGRFVTFASLSPLNVPGDTNGTNDVFVHDRLLGTTARASVDSGGAQSTGTALAAAISSDGRHVSFASDATNLAAFDTNGFFDVFVRGVGPARHERTR